MKYKVFDSHFHIIDPRFPLIANNGYLPPKFDVQDYKKSVANFNIIGGAIVSGSFQGLDQTYLINAIQLLGNKFVGVTQLPATTTDQEIMQLNKQGIRALRFNIKRGGAANIEDLEDFSNRVYALAGWHIELYIDSKDLEILSAKISRLKKFSIDHLGLSKEGFPILKKLVEKGGYVKATGFGRLNFEPVQALRELMQINPKAVMFGTDLPSTRAPTPFSKKDLELIIKSFSEAEIKQILCENALDFYGVQF